MSDIDYLKKYYEGNIDDALKKLKEGLPVQYIIGNVDFFDLNFIVNENVLIPRFETEELVSKLIEYIDFDDIKILDIGTGSGCIAITLASRLNAKVTACDISIEALDVASKNAERNNVLVDFIESNIFSNITGKFNVIVSNPPYIPYSDEIMPLVYNNEPHLALFAEDDGLYFYKEILKNASNFLEDKAIIALEIGINQGEAIKNIALTYFPDSKIIISNDLQGRERFVFVFIN